ncbi:MAG: glucose/arabinose dehydrogenase, partial [Saprospiraceae bacterium]
FDAFLDKIELPKGFKIELYAENVPNARSMCLSPSGTLFVGTRGAGNVYALKDTDGDFKIDKKYTLAEGLEMPNGVALKDGDLYVAEYNRILKFKDIEAILNQPKYEVVTDNYPSKKHHGWKYIAFGPDGKLYIPVGAPCNICESDDKIFNSMTRINSDGTNREIIAEGIRNSVGFDWHPETGELWFTDNGRDWMGDDKPACELNHAPKDGMHFGYPYCHQGDILDPKLGDGKNCDDYTPPVQNLGAHVAALGMEFYTGNQFPANYKNQIFIAEHGSWNRSKKVGYQITAVTVENGKAVNSQPFATGWLDKTDDEAWGRPVDVEMLPDGSMLISDDFADAIYRVSYEG